MATKKKKYYVVWNGHNKGIFDDWDEAKKQITGFAKAQYKSYTSLEEAQKAYNEGYAKSVFVKDNEQAPITTHAERLSIAVDAACSGNPGVMEYRGVTLWDNKQLFHKKFDLGTNNIGEFLAIVHALALLAQNNTNNVIIYSDSQIAIKWVSLGKCKTKLEYTPFTAELFDVIRRAEKWLNENPFRVPIVKWPTERWGEIPADFGRK